MGTQIYFVTVADKFLGWKQGKKGDRTLNFVDSKEDAKAFQGNPANQVKRLVKYNNYDPASITIHQLDISWVKSKKVKGDVLLEQSDEGDEE